MASAVTLGRRIKNGGIAMSSRYLVAPVLLLSAGLLPSCRVDTGSEVPALAEIVQLQDGAQQIKAAVMAAPPELREEAAVLGYTEEGELVPIRRGASGLTCLADRPGDDRFQVACYHDSLEAYMARGRILRTEGISGPDNLQIRHEEIDAGQLSMPSAPATVYTLGGPPDIHDSTTGEVDADRGSRVYSVYIAYATEESTGLSTTPPTPGAPWIMRPGTPTSHIMVVPPGPTTEEEAE